MQLLCNLCRSWPSTTHDINATRAKLQLQCYKTQDNVYRCILNNTPLACRSELVPPYNGVRICSVWLPSCADTFAVVGCKLPESWWSVVEAINMRLCCERLWEVLYGVPMLPSVPHCHRKSNRWMSWIRRRKNCKRNLR